MGRGGSDMRTVRSDREGFTLVELAIVLVIIGLLIGAVLKGSQLVDNAKLKRQMFDLNGLYGNIYTYYDRYGSLPGDANGDGKFDASEEVWTDLETANLANRARKSPFGAQYHFAYTLSQGREANQITVELPREVASFVDREVDDGIYDAGMVRASDSYSGTGRIIIYFFID
jgi:prepilin-type N-terminal cleavage/methylation domain-containing protein